MRWLSIDQINRFPVQDETIYFYGRCMGLKLQSVITAITTLIPALLCDKEKRETENDRRRTTDASSCAGRVAKVRAGLKTDHWLYTSCIDPPPTQQEQVLSSNSSHKIHTVTQRAVIIEGGVIKSQLNYCCHYAPASDEDFWWKHMCLNHNGFIVFTFNIFDEFNRLI